MRPFNKFIENFMSLLYQKNDFMRRKKVIINVYNFLNTLMQCCVNSYNSRMILRFIRFLSSYC